MGNKANRKKLSRPDLDKLRSAVQMTPPAKPYRLWDTAVPAMFVRVQPTGVLSFNVQWSRTSSKALGKYPTLTLDGARQRALAILADASSAADGVPKVAKPLPKAEATTLRQFVELEYLPYARANLDHGQAAADRVLRVFKKYADKPLATLTQKTIEAVITARRGKGIEPATTNRDLATIKAALSKAVEWDTLPANPAAGIRAAKVKEGVVRYLSAEEELALRWALSARDASARTARARTVAANRIQHRDLQPLPSDGYADHLTPLVLVALATGCRRGELLGDEARKGLAWADVDLEAARLAVRGTGSKSGKTRHIPLNSEAVEVLTRWKAQSEGRRVFAVADVKKAWAGVLEAAGIADFRFHDLRHSFASRLVMAGVDLNTVRELLGHADIKMTLRYAHLAPEHKAAAVELLVAPRVAAGKNVTPIRRIAG